MRDGWSPPWPRPSVALSKSLHLHNRMSLYSAEVVRTWLGPSTVCLSFMNKVSAILGCTL